MTALRINEFATRPDLLRRAVIQHQSWIEQQLGVALSKAVILESDFDIVQVGAELLLGLPQSQVSKSSITKRLRPHVLSATFPPELPPLCEVGKAPLTDDLFTFLVGPSPVQRSALTWGDCPISLQIRRNGGGYPLIVMNFAYHPGPRSDYGQVARLVVVRIEDIPAVVTLLDDIGARAKRPRRM